MIQYITTPNFLIMGSYAMLFALYVWVNSAFLRVNHSVSYFVVIVLSVFSPKFVTIKQCKKCQVNTFPGTKRKARVKYLDSVLYEKLNPLAL